MARTSRGRPQPAGTGLAPLPEGVTRSEQAHRILRAAINAGELMPGEIYSVQKLAQQLGVSRTPVREALLQLGRQGLVQPVRNRGFVVLETSTQDIRDIFQIRLLLEPAAAKLATRRIQPADLDQLRAEYQDMTRAARAGDGDRMWKHDRAFHRAIMQASGNTRLAEYIETLRDFVQTRGKLTTLTRQLVTIAGEHEPILSALVRGDARAAQTAMRRHLTETRDILLVQESRAPGPLEEAV